MIPMREGRVTVNRISIHYLAWNSPESAAAPPLILLHGFTDHAWSFIPFVESYFEKVAAAEMDPHGVVAINLRGHGDSGWVQGGYYHFPDYLLDVLGVADEIGAERFSLLGHSMGGMAACLVAGAFPERVEKLILIEGVGPQAMQPEDAPAKFRQWAEDVKRVDGRRHGAVESLDAAARSLRIRWPRLSEAHARFLAETGTRKRPDGALEWKSDPLHRTQSPQPFYLSQSRAFWERIACPVLFVTGAESEFRHFDVSDRLRSFKDLRSEEITGAGHMVHHEEPERLAQAVAGFIRKG